MSDNNKQSILAGPEKFNIGAYTRTHGKSQSPEYRSWCKIKERCFNPSCKEYRYYGGRGIVMCAEWRNNFEAFLAHVGPRPSALYSIERRDNNKGYEPGNVRWATDKEQARNKRNNHNITANGATRCIAEWAELLGVTTVTIRTRLSKGWPPELAVTAPSGYYYNKKGAPYGNQNRRQGHAK